MLHVQYCFTDIGSIPLKGNIHVTPEFSLIQSKDNFEIHIFLMSKQKLVKKGNIFLYFDKNPHNIKRKNKK